MAVRFFDLYGTIAHPGQYRGNGQLSKRIARSVLVHDCWNPKRHTPARAHRICLAHLLRDIEYLKQRFPKQHWPIAIGSIMRDAIALFRKGPPPKGPIGKIGDRLQGLLESPPDKGHKELYAFYRRIA